MAMHFSPWFLLLLLTALVASDIRASAKKTAEYKILRRVARWQKKIDKSLQALTVELKNKRSNNADTVASVASVVSKAPVASVASVVSKAPVASVTSVVSKASVASVTVAPVAPVASSCKDILDRGNNTLQDGVYEIIHKGQKMKVYCDMTRNGGGWTLITAVRSPDGWTPNTTVYARNVTDPSLDHDYSILGIADDIKNHTKGGTFEYRIEVNGRGRWGGIWKAPASYTFTSTNNRQTNVTLVTMFDRWYYHYNGIQKRMPWIELKRSDPLLTTDDGTAGWWGTLMVKDTATHKKKHNLGPWIYSQQYNVNKGFYWLREN